MYSIWRTGTHRNYFFTLSRHYSQSVATSNRRDLYSVIGVSPYATQAQIKEAYYKLSMKYHPDRNEGSHDAQQTFKEITEAYSILGQHQMRLKYDKGLLHDYPPPPHAHKFRRHTQGTAHQQHHASTSAKTTPKYDFDAFYEAHYGEALKREQMARRRKAREPEKTVALSDAHQQLLIILVISLVLLCGWHYGWRSYSNKLKQQLRANIK